MYKHAILMTAVWIIHQSLQWLQELPTASVLNMYVHCP